MGFYSSLNENPRHLGCPVCKLELDLEKEVYNSQGQLSDAEILICDWCELVYQYDNGKLVLLDEIQRGV